ncbi:hypothetical protein E3U36_02710 [Arsenophonus endosymbiont of Aphis craccivora]|uniref:hypothetical protein n=1 Tax=Arsenophonus endosymbiont of Aphis craccivora TaxID=1231049 RepID=UPI0015DD0533|nr:hypothetical protein [Arsenophonus endosymbiont of Aphis craccivora]QLK87353.1 hypothetical protein E3U36_02710 [Arsenophonus endosymbiont of Aphis craccivora]
MLKKSWFRHEAISTKQANRLVKQYMEKGYHVEKTLNTDKKLWDVSVKLEESRKNKPTPRCMINQVCNSPLYKNPTVV